MSAQDAQTSLDDIHRLQDRTRTEYARRGFAFGGVLPMAAALFLVFAAFDLPRPWDVVLVFVGDGLIVATIVVGQLRGRVHRKPGGFEMGIGVAGALVLLGTFASLAIAGRMMDLPVPHTLAAAVTVLVMIVGARLLRPVYEAKIRRGQ